MKQNSLISKDNSGEAFQYAFLYDLIKDINRMKWFCKFYIVLIEVEILLWRSSFEKDTSRLIIYKTRKTQYVRHSIDKLRNQHDVFIGIYYAFTYLHHHKVILK